MADIERLGERTVKMTTFSTQKRLRELVARQTVLPVILAEGFSARRLAFRLFLRHRWRSILCGKTPRLSIPPFGICFPWSCAAEPRLCAEQLLALAEALPDGLPILVPLSEAGNALVTEFSAELESRYIVCDPQRLLSSDFASKSLSHS